MSIKLSFQQRLFLNFSIIFAIFTVLVLIYQFEREKNNKKRQLENTLDNYTELTNNYIIQNSLYKRGNLRLIDSLAVIIPGLDIRITVIDPDGTVEYDSEVKNHQTMENHLHRPEVQSALHTGVGFNIRKSATTGNRYYYYARYYSGYFIRTAALYNVHVKDYLHVEKIFIAYLILLFLLTSLALMIITRRVAHTITKLKDFAISLRSGNEPVTAIEFPNDELGVISSQIASIYRDLNQAKDQISIEKEKLFSHLDALNEGIAFFTSGKKRILTNQQFIQNLNLISEKSNLPPEKFFEINEMAPFIQFIDQQLGNTEPINPEKLPQMELIIQVSNRFFNVRCMFFTDKSFEIVITETTKLEKRRVIKQQMTSNISHELKTPVASILGYLETLQQKGIPEDKRKYFLERANVQAERLSELIEDISTLNKIEEAGENFVFDEVKIRKVVEEVYEHLRFRLEENNIKVNIDLSKKMIVKGNLSLLFSIFYNLFDNVIKYGGQDIEINLASYLEDKNYYYFSFSNTGHSIADNHLPRIFERFYRIDDGRSRKTGGTGLGLAIVKNAIELHKGKITARKYGSGGVEFLFSIKK